MSCRSGRRRPLPPSLATPDDPHVPRGARAQCRQKSGGRAADAPSFAFACAQSFAPRPVRQGGGGWRGGPRVGRNWKGARIRRVTPSCLPATGRAATTSGGVGYLPPSPAGSPAPLPGFSTGTSGPPGWDPKTPGPRWVGGPRDRRGISRL